ncbi:MAG: hypothetical protein RBU37_23255, partial [Myxococcota bacterium]|nr:hypothetical protein [Myxococcota bacterium]
LGASIWAVWRLAKSMPFICGLLLRAAHRCQAEPRSKQTSAWLELQLCCGIGTSRTPGQLTVLFGSVVA